MIQGTTRSESSLSGGTEINRAAYSQPSTFGETSMSLDKKAQPHRMRNASKPVLAGETREEEAARLEKEIAAHPVTRCEPGERGPSSSRPGWSNKPFIPLSERTVAEGIAKKILRKP
jgi:hypothetical protein